MNHHTRLLSVLVLVVMCTWCVQACGTWGGFHLDITPSSGVIALDQYQSISFIHNTPALNITMRCCINCAEMTTVDDGDNCTSGNYMIDVIGNVVLRVSAFYFNCTDSYNTMVTYTVYPRCAPPSLSFIAAPFAIKPGDVDGLGYLYDIYGYNASFHVGSACFYPYSVDDDGSGSRYYTVVVNDDADISRNMVYTGPSKSMENVVKLHFNVSYEPVCIGRVGTVTRISVRSFSSLPNRLPSAEMQYDVVVLNKTPSPSMYVEMISDELLRYKGTGSAMIWVESSANVTLYFGVSDVHDASGHSEYHAYYSTPVRITTSMTVCARAWQLGTLPSDYQCQYVYLSLALVDPRADPPPGVYPYDEPLEIRIRSESPNVIALDLDPQDFSVRKHVATVDMPYLVHYPTSSSHEPLTISFMTVSAESDSVCCNSSSPVTATYTFKRRVDVNIILPERDESAYYDVVELTWSATPGGLMYYTTDPVLTVSDASSWHSAYDVITLDTPGTYTVWYEYHHPDYYHSVRYNTTVVIGRGTYLDMTDGEYNTTLASSASVLSVVLGGSFMFARIRRKRRNSIVIEAGLFSDIVAAPSDSTDIKSNSTIKHESAMMTRVQGIETLTPTVIKAMEGSRTISNSSGSKYSDSGLFGDDSLSDFPGIVVKEIPRAMIKKTEPEAPRPADDDIESNIPEPSSSTSRCDRNGETEQLTTEHIELAHTASSSPSPPPLGAGAARRLDFDGPATSEIEIEEPSGELSCGLFV